MVYAGELYTVFLLEPILISVQTGVPCKWTSDSKHFILENLDTIKDSPSEMYNSTLTLYPSSSWLYEYYSTGVKVVVGPIEWRTCTHTVFCPSYISVLTHWNNTIATNPTDCDITIFDALTGSQTTVLSGHKDYVRSLSFSLDGTLLVSGSDDGTSKLWDIQTGGVIKTLCGHTDWVYSVSISADNTMVASGSQDKTIRLWNIKTGGCYVIEGHKDTVNTITFSPTNSQLFLSSSNDGTVQQWGIDGHQIGSPIGGSHVAFSPDGTQFVSCQGATVTIRNTSSRIAAAEFNLTNNVRCCHFSPNGRFVAAAAGCIIYLWNITGDNPCLVQTLIGHTDNITTLVFPSSFTLISASIDESLKFWQIGAPSMSPVTPDSESTPPTSVPIGAVSLQTKDGFAFSIDFEGVVKTWDIFTGCCKESYKTLIKNISCGDMQVINNRLIVVWCERSGQEIHVCDVEKGELQTVDAPCWWTLGLRIIGDGSRVLQVDQNSIQTWSIWTGEATGKEMLEENYKYGFHPLRMDGSRVLVHSGESPIQGWDFGISGSTPTQFSETSSDRPHLNLIDARGWSNISPVRIENSITGKEVLQLCGQYSHPSAIQWDGQYLIAGYESGEVLILDFSHALP